ncbi:aldehyde dehydrogenase [Roseiconus nitratireducens]|uniref:Aldehyde dehydrogenase n=1 Tax=Roseiconus nitratireducens TaxID=2605748 RepID=A0A5M6CYK3_9BACT|nr:aldehyde dehydrogenase family protein [Roseiconus nitratireducens]KAA5540291.1 aldehyde dehydrogenase [Roseiconus nitratireducens]
MSETVDSVPNQDRDPWARRSVADRCRVVASAAAQITENSETLIRQCVSEQRIDPLETIGSELIPLCAALKYLRQKGKRILAPRPVGASGRPVWMFGVRSVVQRVPHGDVLVLGTWNYPLLLPGSQIAQGLAAGNRVLFKPAPGTEPASKTLIECFHAAGVPEPQLVLLESSTEAAVQALQAGVDLVVLTGAAATGRKVLHAAADQLAASVMELSGCDAVVVLPGFDLDRLIAAIEFGMRFNGSATCIAPRRMLLRDAEREAVIGRLETLFRNQPPVKVHASARQQVATVIESAMDAGAKDRLGRYASAALRSDGVLHPVLLDDVSPTNPIASADVFAPVLSLMRIRDSEDAVRLINECPYRLAASVFGAEGAARALAEQLNVGSVSINDLIATTADPRLPFGGRGDSGFGVTRGAEGLLAMTVPRVISTRRSRFAPHLRPRGEIDQEVLHGALHLWHAGGVRKKMAGLRRMMASVKKR